MFPDYRRVASLGGLMLVLLYGCGSEDTPPDNTAGKSGASGSGANPGGSGGSGANAGGTGGTNTSGSAGAAPAAAGAAGGPADPCVLAITMRNCCWSHVAARQSQVDADPCIADHPLNVTSIPADLDLECRAAQSPPCDPEMNICTLGFSPPPTGAREDENGSCVLTG